MESRVPWRRLPIAGVAIFPDKAIVHTPDDSEQGYAEKTVQIGVVNETDNCVNAFNPAQEDRDANDLGDSCECNVVVIAITGDVNLSKTITSADIISLVNYVFKGGPAPLPCAASGDVNCSGTITSADIIGLVNFVFKSSAPPCDVCTMIPGTWTCP